eukprot:12368586-Alexandrium_andersonii.AAC.1
MAGRSLSSARSRASWRRTRRPSTSCSRAGTRCSGSARPEIQTNMWGSQQRGWCAPGTFADCQRAS